MGFQILNDQSLKDYNTFGIDVVAKYFTSIEIENQLLQLIEHEIFKSAPYLVIGGGSNILFTKKFEGLIIKNDIQGIQAREEGEYIYVSAGGGVIWNDFVQFCVQNSYAGVENLSLIPGTVGAAPVQNIGAYGVELENVFYSCKAFNLKTGAFEVFDNAACEFSYRDSVFKNRHRGKYIIVEVTFRLFKTPSLNISYGAIVEELNKMDVAVPTIQAVSEAVSTIRVSKLPDPSTIGNAGSFFKNPIISKIDFDVLVHEFPDVVNYPAGAASVKVAAGWLIERAGFKGVRIGEAGTWKNQALVLVNHGGATGQEVYDFSERIIEEVYAKFKIKLEREVNIF